MPPRRSRAAAILEDLRAGVESVGGNVAPHRSDVDEVAVARSAIRSAKRRRLEATAVAKAVNDGRRKLPGPKTPAELQTALAAAGANAAELIEQYRKNVEAEFARMMAGEEPVEDGEPSDDNDAQVDLFLALRQDLSGDRLAFGTREILKMSGATTLPTPLDFTNLEVVLDPYMWVIFFDHVGILESDLVDRYRATSDGGRFGLELRRDITEALTVELSEPDEKKVTSLRRLVLHLAQAYVDGDSATALSAFCLQNNYLFKEAKKLCESLYQEYAENAGLAATDLTLGTKFQKIPSWARTATESALKSRLFRPPKQKDSKAEAAKKKIAYDPSKHVVRGEIVHSKREDGSMGRPLGRKK